MYSIKIYILKFHTEVLIRMTTLDLQPHVVVNCAALSIPRACEMDPSAALSINVPSALVKWLSSFTEGNTNTLMIHLSTDQGKSQRTHQMILYYVVLNQVHDRYDSLRCLFSHRISCLNLPDNNIFSREGFNASLKASSQKIAHRLHD